MSSSYLLVLPFLLISYRDCLSSAASLLTVLKGPPSCFRTFCPDLKPSEVDWLFPEIKFGIEYNTIVSRCIIIRFTRVQ